MNIINIINSEIFNIYPFSKFIFIKIFIIIIFNQNNQVNILYINFQLYVLFIVKII